MRPSRRHWPSTSISIYAVLVFAGCPPLGQMTFKLPSFSRGSQIFSEESILRPVILKTHLSIRKMEKMMSVSVTSESRVTRDHRSIIGGQNTRLTAKRRSAGQSKHAVRRRNSLAENAAAAPGIRQETFEREKREKWQLQHLGNYLHTESVLMRSAAPLLALFALAPRWCRAAGITPDSWLAPLCTRNFLLSLAQEGWGPSAI